MAGSKFDEDLYKKVDLSLIPWWVLESIYPKKVKELRFMKQVHQTLSYAQDNSIMVPAKNCFALFRYATETFSITKLAVSLGYGERKYSRNNWKEGFGGNTNRLLKACLRHCHWLLMGELYDGEALEGYPTGNSHEGAILFSLMVAWYEARRLEEKEEGDEEEGIS